MEQAPNQPDQCCAHCGTALTGETTGGLCPRCLLEMNFASRTMPGGETSPQVPPPTPEEMADRFPQFEILECLGRGGMGIVYKARQKTLDRLVAIKVLAGERHDDPQFEARFSREAKTLAKLSHPNIVTVHDFGESDGMFYLVMEFVDGVNLRDVLSDGRMEPKQALAIVPAICEALQFVHDHGVVHRDIKPENILMDRDGRVKIADFGIATLVGADAERSGTPPYMAPEQEAAEGSIDHRADIYALGVVFYEMLTGERPAQDPSRPSQRVEIDVRLDEIVLRALEKEPAQRYQTAGEFRTVVETMAERGTSPAIHPDASAAGPQTHGRWRGIDRRSKHTFFGLPLWHVATGFDPKIGRPRTARGIIAIGDRAQGVVAIGGVAMGGFAFGGLSIGAVSYGGMAVGLLAMGGFGLALIAAFAGFAMAPIALGGMAVGWYAFGGRAFGGHVISATEKNDPAALDFFEPWATSVMTTAGIANIAIIAFVLLLGVGLPVWMQRSSARPHPTPAGKQRRRLAALVGIIAFMIVGATALLVWLQRPQRIDEPNIAATSPDGMYSATGQTWHAMRIFGSDRTYYRFIVRGEAGAVAEKWEVPVPHEKLPAWDHVVAGDEVGHPFGKILFGRHGRILWSDDSRWASFQVHGVEVAGFDADAGKPTDPGKALNTPEQVAREHMEAIYSGDADRALSLLGPPRSESREDIKEAIWRLQIQGRTMEEVPEFLEWCRDGRYAVTSWEYPSKENGVDHNPYHRKPYLVLERFAGTWRVVWGFDIRAEASLSEILRCFERFRSVSREDPKAVARAFIAAFGKGDVDVTEMLSAPPLIYQRDELARAIAQVGQAQEASGRKPASPLGWHQEDPYAVTRARLLPDKPEIETYLVLKRTGKIWRVVGANISSPDASLAENLQHYKENTMVARLTVDDLALRFLVAIREQDETTLRELCIDRTEGWTEAVLGQFSLELRERFRQSTGEEFALYPGKNRIDHKRKEKDLAVVQCFAVKDLQKKLDGNILVLYFCRTGSGWKIWTIRKAPESQSLEHHLEQARKWAAEWEDGTPGAEGSRAGPSTPEQVARSFMKAFRDGDIDAAMAQLTPEMKAQVRIRKVLEGLSRELREEFYAGHLDRLTEFTEWYPRNRDANTRFVGTRVTGIPADDGTEREHSLYLILSPTPEGWKVAHLDDAYSDKPLSWYVDRIVRIIPGEGPEFRDLPAEAAPSDGTPSDLRPPDPLERAKALPVTPPATMPEGSPVTVEQAKKILEGVTWGEFIEAFADDGKGQEVSWKEANPEGGSGLRFEISFQTGGERLRLDLDVDPEFQRATPSRLRAAGNAKQVKTDASEFLPLMVTRYAVQSGHPAVAAVVGKFEEQALQAKTLSTMREYAVAIAICLANTGTLPSNLQALVEKKYLREAALMMNHETGKMEVPLYHGGPDLRVGDADVSKIILLASPSADRTGRRVVGFLDSHVAAIDEADYQAQLKAQHKPPHPP